MLMCLQALQLEGSTLLVLDEKNEFVYKSAHNLPNVKTLLAGYLNVVDLLKYNNVLIARSAVDTITSYLGNPDAEAATADGQEETA
jgi:large subunit ribosomal protein L4